MMREQLQQEHPNIFSLPGETEIKKKYQSIIQSNKERKIKQ